MDEKSRIEALLVPLLMQTTMRFLQHPMALRAIAEDALELDSSTPQCLLRRGSPWQVSGLGSLPSSMSGGRISR
jgi:hypothetical protein